MRGGRAFLLDKDAQDMHTRSITRAPHLGQTNVIESVILLLLTVFFRSWDNFQPVIQNLSKYYAKTP